MNQPLTRRDFFGILGAASLAPLVTHAASAAAHPFRIRTITAGVQLESLTRLAKLRQAVDFLQHTGKQYMAAGYEVQTLRIATQPLHQYRSDWTSKATLKALQALDRLVQDHGVILSIGQVISSDRSEPAMADWAARLMQSTRTISFTVNAASEAQGIHEHAIASAAETMAAIAQATAGGEGNFRFAATAFCPPGTPFFPAAFHRGGDDFSIGLESPGLLQTAFSGAGDFRAAKTSLLKAMESALQPVQKLAQEISRARQRPYLGIDVSPAPGLDASIGQAIETLTGRAFGSPSTLSACAAITDVLKSLTIKTCGYSGLMLPVLEDPVLARRAAEQRYGVAELLLYSSVCGTGLDVVPLPGDTSVKTLHAIIRDMAALSSKYHKPLSARLFPVPGKRAGQAVHFDNPFLTDSVVMHAG